VTSVRAERDKDATEPPGRGKIPILLESGDLYRAEIIEVTPSEVRVRMMVDGNPVETAILREEIEPHSMYEILRARMSPKTAADQMVLGGYAHDLRLWGLAERHFRNAIRMDPSLQETLGADLNEVRAKMAETLLDRVRTLVNSKQKKEAQRIAGILIEDYGDTDAAAKTVKMREEGKLEARAEDEALGEIPSEGGNRELRRAGHLYRRAVDYWTAALSEPAATGDSLEDLERSLEALDRAAEIFEDLEPALQEAAEPHAMGGLDALIREQKINSLLQLAATLAIRGSIYRALDRVNQVFLIDASNPDAKRMRERIVTAALDSGYHKRYRRR
jgi:hypothetical protein